MRVLKWPLRVDDSVQLIGPGHVINVDCQSTMDAVMVWTLEPDETPSPTRKVQVIGTGQRLPDESKHLGSAVTPGGWLVWHVFEVA